ncbi:unnamed protein product, partial [Mesorhabditis belari]|uniref:Uncharacterized protein n=1 Tax=Mesorhabditis belari TaxID=2138241 RepID=A0AAF3EQR9_9BILA
MWVLGKVGGGFGSDWICDLFYLVTPNETMHYKIKPEDAIFCPHRVFYFLDDRKYAFQRHDDQSTAAGILSTSDE